MYQNGPNISGNILRHYLQGRMMQNALAEKDRGPVFNALETHGGPARTAAHDLEHRDGMSPEAEAAYAALAEAWGLPLTVTSAYRSPEHNARVGGAKRSQHMHGNAYDFDVSNLSHEKRLELIRAARRAGFRGVGVYDNSLHFDVGAARHWGPDYSSGSTPSWAFPALG